jgi:hypothetical protein
MIEPATKKVASASALSAITTALFAWLAANHYSAEPEQPATTPAAATAKGSSADAARQSEPIEREPYDESLVLRPLLDAVFGAGTDWEKPNLQSLRSDIASAGPVTIRSLIAAVPDPKSSLGFRFDETIDSIEEAARVYGYVLERWRLPAQSSSTKPKVNTEHKGQPRDDKDKPKQPAGSSPEPVAGDPGLLVFRKAGVVTGRGVPRTDLLLVFLITETPTQGVDRLAFTRALKFADSLRNPRELGSQTTRRISVVAPCFSGSMPSLRDALRDWLASLKGAETGKCNIEILSGTASAFPRADFEDGIKAGLFDKLNDLRFSSMTHHFEDVLRVVLDFLGRATHASDVAIFSEVDTGFGESVSVDSSRVDAQGGPVTLQYPSQIAEIRRRYEVQGLMKDKASDVLGPSGELRARGDSELDARDVFPDLTPDWAALSENRVLTQALRYLEDSRFKFVGIIGTDPRDTVFLARLINRYCPDARLFTIGSDLLYLDTQSIADLRGMIIGSTYPLYAANHSWTGSDPKRRGKVFPSEDAQGMYNAAAVQIARLTVQDGAESGSETAAAYLPKFEAENLLEYSTPLPLRNGGKGGSDMPPVWVSVVGERSLYPVDCRLPELDSKSPELEYLYRAWPSDDGPRRLMINRSLAWVVFLAVLSLVLLTSYCRRAHHAVARSVSFPTGNRRRAPETELALTLARVLILAGYLYISCPALARLVPGTVELNLATGAWPGIFQWAILVVPITVILAALMAPITEFRASRSHWRALEAVGAALVVILVGCVQVNFAASPRWLLSLDRSAAITGGVSAQVPVAFLMAALGAWLYSRHRISMINATFAFAPEHDQQPLSAGEVNRTILKQIDVHRARFDRWSMTPAAIFSFIRKDGISWRDFQPTLIAAVLVAGAFFDTIVFRPISWSDEGIPFDLFFRLAFALVLTLIALNFARIHTAWGDFQSVLDSLAMVLGDAFERIPRNVSNWLIDADRCNAEYGHMIRRQLNSARAQLAGWDLNAEPPKTSVAWHPEEALGQLAILENHVGGVAQATVEEQREQLASFRYFARALSPYWAVAAIGDGAKSEQQSSAHDKQVPGREEKLITDIENLLALEAARWVGGALVRIWISIGFLALAAVFLLFAITSYPFPEQSRVMTVIGFAIAAIVVMILRVALGSNRNEVISKLDGTTPGRITWNSTLFSSIGAYVVPLLGLLTAVSFNMLDLFRSVLGPILRIFP